MMPGCCRWRTRWRPDEALFGDFPLAGSLFAVMMFRETTCQALAYSACLMRYLSQHPYSRDVK
jgi:hypothetical protein